jgi:acetolactate synthase I/II/III large subunit
MSGTTVAAVIADGLARAGTRRLFATADASAAVLDAMRARGVTVVEVVGATAACIMAAVTGELEDAPGAAAVSLADGVTAAIDGAAHATRDRAPVIILSDGTADAGLLEPVTKASLVADAASAGHWIAHSAQLSMAAPRGAVHLAIRPDVAATSTLPVATSCRRAPLPTASPPTLDALADRIAAAARPILIVGLAIDPDAAKWVRALAETLPAPVLSTPKGKGAIPDPHPLALGLLTAGHPLTARADLLVALGVDPVEISPGAWPVGVETVHVSAAAAGDTLYRPVVEVSADIALVIEELAPRLRGRAGADWDVAELDRVKRALTRSAPAMRGLTRRRVVTLVREATPAGTVATLAVPLADAWQSVAPRELLIPNGAATAGFALPAAVAAALARQDRRVVALGAASGLVAMAGELSTVARLDLPIIIVALDQDETAMRLMEPARAAGFQVSIADDEPAFGRSFTHAWAAARPALIVARVQG